jgi:hypothetical protein
MSFFARGLSVFFKSALVGPSAVVVRSRVRKCVGPHVHGRWCGPQLCASQFHLPFYASRPLPNTFALVLVTAALGFIARGRHRAGEQRAALVATVALRPPPTAQP